MRAVRGGCAGDLEIEMMTMRSLIENRFFSRFVSCVNGVALLKIAVEVAGRAAVGRIFLIFPAGLDFSGDFPPTPKTKMNLTRREIFRGKILRRKNQNQPTDLEERTQPAPKK
jgi:hypothetical protein